jgi:hypothetical protein
MAKTKRSNGAVAKAWAIFTKHSKDRAEALAAAEKAGINKFTAATQWQKFNHASPAERKAKLDGGSGKKKEGKKNGKEKAVSVAAAQ